MASYNILKCNYKGGTMSILVSNWILIPHFFIEVSPKIVFTVTSLPIPNYFGKVYFLVPKEY